MTKIARGPDPDPLVRGTDPRIRIRIRTKMSRIRNTALHHTQLFRAELLISFHKNYFQLNVELKVFYRFTELQHTQCLYSKTLLSG